MTIEERELLIAIGEAVADHMNRSHGATIAYSKLQLALDRIHDRDKFFPKAERRVDERSVTCPTCNAPVGAKCVRDVILIRTGDHFHYERWELARTRT